ncbi:hypothetical protein COV82_01340 [Candidatus Peregrinibacteria bacterium CG11_big_fil_rev_8_21_14_0_20_46_8]|nr:MAG: hypothetical protein COV82_01340 [Candidatus Peregrinibacteria bacterium CG11_big_fil_rev_8_21_14_0_20_46_8]
MSPKLSQLSQREIEANFNIAPTYRLYEDPDFRGLKAKHVRVAAIDPDRCAIAFAASPMQPSDTGSARIRGLILRIIGVQDTGSDILIHHLDPYDRAALEVLAYETERSLYAEITVNAKQRRRMDIARTQSAIIRAAVQSIMEGHHFSEQHAVTARTLMAQFTGDHMVGTAPTVAEIAGLKTELQQFIARLISQKVPIQLEADPRARWVHFGGAQKIEPVEAFGTYLPSAGQMPQQLMVDQVFPIGAENKVPGLAVLSSY